MKLKKIMLALVMSFALVALVACGGNKKKQEATFVIYGPNEAEVGSTFSYEIQGTTEAVVWSSSDETVATIQAGQGKALAIGKTTITVALASNSAVSLTKELSVVAVGTAKSIKLNGSSATIAVAESYQLTPEAENTTSTALTYKSSNEAIATVSTSGKITAVAVGSAIISVILSEDITNGVASPLTATFKVTVVAEKLVQTITITPDTMLVKPNATAQITPTLTNASATDVSYSSSNDAVATVSASGLVSGIANGQATVTARLGDLTATVTIIVSDTSVTISGDKSVNVSERITLTAKDATSDDATFLWESSNTAIATVSSAGVVKGKKAGTVTITATNLDTNEAGSLEISVVVPNPTTVTLGNLPESTVYTTTNLYFTSSVAPSGADQTIVWDSSDETIATVDEGTITIVGYGKVTITAASAVDATVMTSVELDIVYDIMQLIDDAYLSMPYVNSVTAYGSTNYQEEVLGGVFMFSLQDYTTDWKTQNYTTEKICPLGDNRPGTIKSSTEFILVHDTANTGTGANGSAHANYVAGGGGGTSWHYTVGSDGVWHQVPNDEVAYHAGDGTGVTWSTYYSGVKATTTVKPTVTIDAKGYYALNGTSTVVKAPTKSSGALCTTADINDAGIFTTIGDDGYWYLGTTWWSSTYQYIGNHGGNNNSIGIETCVNVDGDLYKTWSYTAKLVARLMVTYHLGIDRVVPHHFFSGKDCPMTMRHAGYWETFKKMVWYEYLMETLVYSQGYTVSFSSSNTEIISNEGRVVMIPKTATAVSVTIKVENKTTSFSQSKTYTPIVHY